MRLALLSPIHGQSIDHIARQLENYRTFLTPFKLRHFLHLSLESSHHFNTNSLITPIRKATTLFSPTQASHLAPCTAYALKELIKTCASIHLNHIIPHSYRLRSAVLPQSQKNHLISQDRLRREGLNPKSRWKWNGPAQQDPRLKAFARDYADSRLRNLFKGGVCGCSLPQKTFLHIQRLSQIFSISITLIPTPNSEWPLAEIAIPSILRLATDPSPTPFHPALISAPKTKQDHRQASIKQALRKKSSFGMKKIARDTQSEAFTFLMDLQVKAQNKHALNASRR